MKIVHVEDFFHPNAGYQINILPKYMVKQGHSVTIITSEMEKIPEHLTTFFGRDDIRKQDMKYSELTGVDIIRLPLKDFISGRAVFTRQLFKTIKYLKPDVLYVHGNDTLTAIRCLLRLKKLNCPIVLDSHMLEMASINKFSKIFRIFYKAFFTPIIIRNEIPVIRTQDDPYVEKHLGIPLKQCPWISVGSDTILFHPDKDIRYKFRKEYKIHENDFVVVYTGKLDDAKGGKFLAEAFIEKFNNSKNKKVVLVVVGNTSGEYGKQVEEVFEKSQNKIIRFATQKYIDLAQFYQAADLSVFPKQCSLSFYDAQACGLPVISEDNNINIARLQKDNGFNFISGDINDFRSKIVKCIEMDEVKFNEISQNAFGFVRDNYNYEIIARQYSDILYHEHKRIKNGGTI